MSSKLTAVVQTVLDDETIAASSTWQVPGLPHASVSELRDLANICKAKLRVVKIQNGARLEGLSVCCLEPTVIHGVRVKAYKIFGGHFHDYNRLYARDRRTLAFLLQQICRDARATGSDVVDLYNLLIPRDVDLIPNSYISSFSSCMFDAKKSVMGWRQIFGTNGHKLWKRATRLPGFHVETAVGVLTRTQMEDLARLHQERWRFEGKSSAFDDPRRLEEYMCNPTNKLLTTITVEGEVLVYLYGMVYGELVVLHTVASNVKFWEYSPLKLALFATAKYCERTDLKYFDFGLGSENYKNSYENTERLVCNVLYPISPRGRIVHLLRAHGRPAAVKIMLGKVRRHALRIKQSIAERCFPLQWYEAKSVTCAAAPPGNSFACLENYELFVDFCRQYKLAVEKEHYRRFKDGAFFVALHCGSKILSNGWCRRAGTLQVPEINRTVPIGDRLVLYDLHHPHDSAEPRNNNDNNAIVELFQALGQMFPGKILATFTSPSATVVKAAILQAGFSAKPFPEKVTPSTST
jgi:CelD/BcsL family acetyltransferase involved in cellulose biosynthesis